MSLKAFHIFFILVSIALTLWLGFYALPSNKAAGSAAFAAAAALTAYLVWFLLKLKRMSKV